MSSSQGVSDEVKTATYKGGCHCGRVKFTMKHSPPIQESKVMSCNCSICATNGLLLVFPKHTDIEWHSGEDEMTGYTFYKKAIIHSFCPTCGTNVRGKVDASNDIAINVRTLEGIDFDSLTLNKVDGKRL